MLLFLAVTDEKTSSNVRIVIDENLFPQIAEGNRDSFVRLYELTKDLVYAYSLSILRNRDDAEDDADAMNGSPVFSMPPRQYGVHPRGQRHHDKEVLSDCPKIFEHLDFPPGRI